MGEWEAVLKRFEVPWRCSPFDIYNNHRIQFNNDSSLSVWWVFLVMAGKVQRSRGLWIPRWRNVHIPAPIRCKIILFESEPQQRPALNNPRLACHYYIFYITDYIQSNHKWKQYNNNNNNQCLRWFSCIISSSLQPAAWRQVFLHERVKDKVKRCPARSSSGYLPRGNETETLLAFADLVAPPTPPSSSPASCSCNRVTLLSARQVCGLRKNRWSSAKGGKSAKCTLGIFIKDLLKGLLSAKTTH